MCQRSDPMGGSRGGYTGGSRGGYMGGSMGGSTGGKFEYFNSSKILFELK